MILIIRIELFRLNERVIKEERQKVKKRVKNRVFMHWNSAFCKESQCNYVNTDENCYIHLQG